MFKTQGKIRHREELKKYLPPGHQDTVNVRLTDKNFCQSFELIQGTIEPGGVAEAHSHESEYQVIYILDGVCDVILGDRDAVECREGSIVEIPPKILHHVKAKGNQPLKVLVIYSPPLPKRDDIVIE